MYMHMSHVHAHVESAVTGAVPRCRTCRAIALARSAPSRAARGSSAPQARKILANMTLSWLKTRLQRRAPHEGSAQGAARQLRLRLRLPRHAASLRLLYTFSRENMGRPAACLRMGKLQELFEWYYAVLVYKCMTKNTLRWLLVYVFYSWPIMWPAVDVRGSKPTPSTSTSVFFQLSVWSDTG